MLDVTFSSYHVVSLKEKRKKKKQDRKQEQKQEQQK